MDIDRFWGLIEQARAAAGPAVDQAVRDYDEPDDDPDRDYWDFDDLELQEALEVAGRIPGDAGQPALNGREGKGTEEGDEDEDLEDLEDDEDDEEEDEITDPVAVALLPLLTQLSAAEIAAFENLFEDLRSLAETDDMANAAVLIEHGFLGDDSFDDFRAGLVALGRSTFEAAVANPDSLATHPLVREIAAANDPRWLGREDMLFVASHAYALVTGEDEVTFYEFAEEQRDGEAAGLPDELPAIEWSVTDEGETRRRLPQLADLFYGRSMRNRARAMEKLGLRD
jgi:hypothetical protein